jgi:TRAP-type C4-dicarboxylate transport system substrate-binding protein
MSAAGAGRGAALILLTALASLAAPRDAAAARVLRLATSAPKGTSWARALDQFASTVTERTRGAVTVKIFYGGAAGEEPAVFERMEKGQLDGTISGGHVCTQIMPTMRVLHSVGLFESEDEALYVAHELSPTLAVEARARGYELVGLGSLGPIVLFSRAKVKNYGDVVATRAWAWELSTTFVMQGLELAWTLVTLPLAAATPAYEDGRVDGYWTTPVAALSFQWYSQVRYVLPLEAGYLIGCVVLRQASLDPLDEETRTILREEGAKFALRIDEATAKMTRQLLASTFPKQGVAVLPVVDAVKRVFHERARVMRGTLIDRIAPPGVIDRVDGLLRARRRARDDR